MTIVAQACAASNPLHGSDDLLLGLGKALPDLSFRLALKRGGWYRSGGVVDIDKQRVADSLRAWAEQCGDGELQPLLDQCLQRQLFATRLVGRTHYLTAKTGPAAADFIQLEVEELQEVLERYLSDPDWLPDNLEEFIDPLEYSPLEPEPVGTSRLVFRRFFAAREMLNSFETSSSNGLSAFLRDWQASSAGSCGHFCDHWVLGMRESTDINGEAVIDAHPVSVEVIEPAAYTPAINGADLAAWIHGYDHKAGYPMAWFFHMLASAGVPLAVGMQVADDHDRGFDYLPAKDLGVLRGWVATPYRA